MADAADGDGGGTPGYQEAAPSLEDSGARRQNILPFQLTPPPAPVAHHASDSVGLTFIPSEAPTPLKWPSGAARGIQRVRYSHEAMARHIVALEGRVTQNELADHFGRTPSWISQVINSDAFQNCLAELNAELVDPAIRATIKEQFDGLVRRSIAIMQAKLDKHPDKISTSVAMRAFEITTRAAGYGARGAPVPVQINVNNHLETLGSNLDGLLRRKRAEAQAEDIDAKILPIDRS